MVYELRENSGNAFNNNFKQPEDNKPDFTGEHLNEDDKKTAKGDTFIGYVISAKQEPKPSVNKAGGFNETDIPF